MDLTYYLYIYSITSRPTFSLPSYIAGSRLSLGMSQQAESAVAVVVLLLRSSRVPDNYSVRTDMRSSAELKHLLRCLFEDLLRHLG